jgi:hypothetical protein
MEKKTPCKTIVSNSKNISLQQKQREKGKRNKDPQEKQKNYTNINQEISIQTIINRKITNIILIIVLQEIHRY